MDYLLFWFIGLITLPLLLLLGKWTGLIEMEVVSEPALPSRQYKYIVKPGMVDGTYISAETLIHLYHVRHDDCIVSSEWPPRGVRVTDYIVLEPRADGDYRIPR